MIIEQLESRRHFSTGSIIAFPGVITGTAYVSTIGNSTPPATITIGDLHLPPGAAATVTLDQQNPFKGTATLTKAGTLVITGTADADRISITLEGDTIKIPMFVNGETLSVGVKTSQIKRILVEAGAGNDKVFIHPAIARHVTVAGGGGNDTLDGNDNCTLIGGSGNDHLYASAKSVLNGGDGNDTLAGGSNDSLTGGAGHDLAVLLNSNYGIGAGVISGAVVGSHGNVNGQPIFAQISSIEQFEIDPSDVIELHLSNP